MNMRLLATLPAILAGAVAVSASADGPVARFSEVMFDPFGIDRGQEFIELTGTPGASLDDIWIVCVDGAQQFTRGKVTNAIPLRTIAAPITAYSLGSNGLFLLRDGLGVIDSSGDDGVQGPSLDTVSAVRLSTSSASGFGNGATGLKSGTFTMLLVRGYNAAVTDIDANNDGIADAAPWTEVLDAFAYVEGSGVGYAPTGFPTFRSSVMGFSAGAFVRAFDGNLHAAVPVGVNTTPATNEPLISPSGPYFLPPGRIWPAVAGVQYIMTPGRPNPATPNDDSLCGSLLVDASAGSTQLFTNWGLPNVDPRAGGCDWGDPTVGAIGAARVARFVPTVSGPHVVSLCGSGISDTVLAVQTECAGGTTLACNDDGGSCPTVGQSELTVNLQAGVAVYVAAGSFMFTDDGYPGATGSLRLTITPPDDGCNSLEVIPSGGGSLLAGATAGFGDLELPAGTFASGDQRIHHARYVRFTPAQDGVHFFTTCGTGGTVIDSRLAILDGCGATGALLASADGGCNGGLRARIAANLLAGQPYTIAVGSATDGDAGTVGLVVARDADNDGTADGADGCPGDPAKTSPGACGCGAPDVDSDGDGVPDCLDACPNDPNKTSPGSCGCGNPETDSDGDGVPNCVDNCPQVPNPSQADCDHDGIGDACAGGIDCNADGIPDSCQVGQPGNDLNLDGVLDACQHPRVVLTAGAAYAPGQDVVVSVSFHEILGLVVGGQLSLYYDRSLLTYASADIGGEPFGTIIYEQHLPAWSQTQGRVRIAIGLPLDGSTTGVANGTLVRLHFTAKGASCSPAPVISLEGGTTCRLTNSGGSSLAFAAQNMVGIIVDGTAPVLSGVPAAVAPVPADAGRTDGALQATISNAAVTANDDCGGTRPVTVAVTLPDSSTTSTIPSRFAVGTTTVRWSAVDDAGNLVSETRSVVVEPYQVLRVTPAVNGAMAGSGPRTLSFDVAGQGVETHASAFTLAQGAAVELHVPVAATAPCVTVREAGRTLSSRLVPAVQGTAYEASCTLVAGDANGDEYIDILDFGVFVGDYGRTVARDARSNFNADLVVSSADFTFITASFLRAGDSCAPAFDGRGPIERITVKELRRRGLGDLAVADLNRDGVLDWKDVAVAMQRGLGGPGETPVGDTSAIRPSGRSAE